MARLSCGSAAALDVGRFDIGVTEKRAQWAIRWVQDKVLEGAVRLGELREGLGRLQLVAGPLDNLGPFLGPLYAWVSAGPRYAKPKLPVMIRLILDFLAKELAVGGNRVKHTPGRAHAPYISRNSGLAIGTHRLLDPTRLRVIIQHAAHDMAWTITTA